MSHVRTKIREAMIALIESVSGLSGRVVADPAEIQDADASPWVEVAVGEEQPRPTTFASVPTGRRLTRPVAIFAEIHTRGRGKEPIDQYDALLALIEVKVFQSSRLDGLLLSPLTLALVQPQNPDLSGSLPAHALRLQWAATYVTTEADPTSTA